MPPDAVAMYQSDGSLSGIAMSVIRPAMLAGPIDRHFTFLTNSESIFIAGGKTKGLAGVFSTGFTAGSACLTSAGLTSGGFGCLSDCSSCTIFSRTPSIASNRSVDLSADGLT